MKKTIEVVFTQNSESHLKGDKAQVSLGYAENYLFPKNIAVNASDVSAKELIKKMVEERAKIQKDIDDLKKQAEELRNKEITITVEAGPAGKIFGSVGAEQIAKELKLDEKKIKVKPIKEVGEHKVTIDLGNNVKTEIIVIIKKTKVGK